MEGPLNAQIADIGARQNRVEVKGNVLSDLNTDLQERLSEVQDSDIAEVISAGGLPKILEENR